jgi:hypothetical protein
VAQADRVTQIREATPDDWPAIWRFFPPIVAAGETYAYDPSGSVQRGGRDEHARRESLWRSLAFEHRTEGFVGLHVMYLRL